MGPKNNVNIRLTEPVVFLRGSAESTVTGRRGITREAQPALVRGLLVLNLDKPTKISSIELTLEGKTQTSWPEGVGARKLEITEEHEIFSSTVGLFKAGKDSVGSARRTASIGPGLVMDHEDIEDDSTSNEEVTHSRPRRPSSNAPWFHRRRISVDHHFSHLPHHHPSLLDDIPTPPYSPPGTRPTSFIRRDSNQSSSTAPAPLLFPRHESSISLGHESVRSRLSDNESNHTGQDGPSHIRPPLSHETNGAQSSSSSFAELSLSRPDSHDTDSAAQQPPQPPTPQTRSRSRGRPPRSGSNASTSRAPSLPSSIPQPMTPLHPAPAMHSANSSASNSASILAAHPHMAEVDGREQSSSPHRERGRHHSRFSLMTVSNALLDAVKERVRSTSRSDLAKENHGSPAASREHSPDGVRGLSRRRDTEPAVAFEERGRQSSREEEAKLKQKQKERSTLGKIGDALGLDMDHADGEGSWKEFRKGIYTYPISIAVPADSPPTLQCEFGSVTYRLKATVHRPGTFTHRLTASREVTIIASPGEDDVEESDNIVVQREWDSQMHYLIIISGRAFPIGSTIPIHITFMPIAKIKVFRLSAVIEEKVEYLTQFKRVARVEPIRKFELLSVRHHTKEATQILPMISDYTDSPLQGYVNAEDASDAASTLMGPGPWDIITNLELPKSCAKMHFTNKHKRSNISISHTLKLVFRVERGDDEFVDARTGQRKHFDIVVQTPMHILSCHCNYEWTSLPRYSYMGSDTLARMQTCPCEQRRVSSSAQEEEHMEVSIPPLDGHSILATPTHPHSHSPFHTLFHPPDLSVVGEQRQQEEDTSHPTTQPTYLDPSPIPLSRLPSDTPSDVESLYQRNAQFARLVAGEESELGEAPPRYEFVANRENILGAQATADVIASH